jgi:hypothetical protein
MTPITQANARLSASGQFYTGPAITVVDDSIHLGGVELVERAAEAFVTYEMAALPPTVTVGDFAFAVLGASDGDRLAVSFNGTEVWTLPVSQFARDTVYLGQIPASLLAGTGSVRFSLVGAGASNALVLIGSPDAAVFGFGEPDAPQNLNAIVEGTSVTLNWSPLTPVPTQYFVQAALAPQGPTVATLNAGQATTLTTTAPPGRYWARVVAVNGVGASRPSVEIEVAVGCSVPAAPSNFEATATGTLATLAWVPMPNTSYFLEVGSVPGATNLGSFQLPSSGVFSASAPVGVYYVRLRASNACGASPPSIERVVTLVAP